MHSSRHLLCSIHHVARKASLSSRNSAKYGAARAGFASAVSMDLLKELRSQSGAPIVDCKKALENTNNDLSSAMDWLREHGAAKASSKVQGRETTEGLVSILISADQKTASLVKVESETDFAGRSDKFLRLVYDVAEATLATTADEHELNEVAVLKASFQGKTVKTLLDEAIVAIRENLSISKAMKLKADDGILVGYVHNRVGRANAGTSAALVEVASAGNAEVANETLESVGKRLAMHIVAARPLYLKMDDVPQREIEKEREILFKQQELSGKPADVIEKVVSGRLRKFLETICLMEQGHMIEEKSPKVSKVLKDHGVLVKRFEQVSIS